LKWISIVNYNQFHYRYIDALKHKEKRRNQVGQVNSYEILINSIKRKYNTLVAAIEENNIVKKKLEGQMDHKIKQIESINNTINEKNDILGNLLDADNNINKVWREYKIIGIFDILIGVIFGIAAFYIANNYTSEIFFRLLTAIITATITSCISTECDYYRAKKEVKPLEELKERYSIEEIQDNIDELTTERCIVEQQLDKTKSKLTKNNKDTQNINEKISEVLSQLDTVMSAFDSAKLELGHNASDKKFNTRFNNDQLIEESMALKRKKEGKNG